jgi:hypothetical protein
MCYDEIVRRGSNTDPSGSVNERRTASAGNTPVRVGTSKQLETPMSTVSRPSPKGQSVRPSRVRPEPTGLARLELLINGNRYKVRPTSLGSIAEVRTWRLRKPDGTIHIVSQAPDGHITCTCKDSVARTSSKTRCKHILSLLAVGLLDGKGGAE